MLGRLVIAKNVLRQQALNGSLINDVSEAGSRRLQQIEVPAISGKELMRRLSTAYFQHYVAANEIAIRGIINRHRVLTHGEIARDK